MKCLVLPSRLIGVILLFRWTKIQIQISRDATLLNLYARLGATPTVSQVQRSAVDFVHIWIWSDRVPDDGPQRRMHVARFPPYIYVYVSLKYWPRVVHGTHFRAMSPLFSDRKTPFFLVGVRRTDLHGSFFSVDIVTAMLPSLQQGCSYIFLWPSCLVPSQERFSYYILPPFINIKYFRFVKQIYLNKF
jgi:hypothetical protein